MSQAGSSINPFRDDGIKIGKPTRAQDTVIRMRCRLANPGYQKAVKSGKAECIAKVASHAKGGRVKALLEYIARTEPGQDPVELETESGALHQGQEDVQEIYKEWSQGFEEKNPESERSPRHATHLILSGNAENTPENRKKLLSAGRQVAVKHFGDRGYDFVLALHEEGGKAHVHVVIRNRHRDNGPKLRLNPPELLDVRTDLAKYLTELGIEHVATLRKDRPQVAELVRNGVEQIKKRESQFHRRMKAASPVVDAFMYRKGIARNILHLRERVKQETLPLSPERKKLLGSLRQLERKLVTPGADLKKEIAATLSHFEKETVRFRGFVKDFKDPELTPKAAVRDRKRSLDQLAEGLETRIRDARLSIQISSAPAFEKKASLALLKEYEKEVSRSFQDPAQKVRVKTPVLEGQLYQQLEKLEAQDKKFNQDFRFGRADQKPGEHNQAIQKAIDQMEKQVKSKSLIMQSGRMELLEKLDGFRAKTSVRAEVWQGIKNLETADRKTRPQIQSGENEDLTRLRALVAGNDHFTDKDKTALTTSFDKLERAQDARFQVGKVVGQDKEHWERVEAGRAVAWPKEEHPRNISKAIEDARLKVKTADIPDQERKALFKEVGKLRQKVAGDEIRTVGAGAKIESRLAMLDKKDRQHWQDRASIGTAEKDLRHSNGVKKSLVEIRTAIKAGKFPTEERKALYQAVKKQDFASQNRAAAAQVKVKVQDGLSKVVKQDLAFYKGLQTNAGSSLNKIKQHGKQVSANLAVIRKGIKEAKLPADDRREMYRQTIKAGLAAKANQKRFTVAQEVKKTVSVLTAKNDQFRQAGRNTRREHDQHKKEMAKQLRELRQKIKDARFPEQERRKLFRDTLKAESLVPKAKKLMRPEDIISRLKVAAEEHEAALKRAGKNPKKIKNLNKEMEKKIEAAARKIRATQAPDVAKFKARKKLNQLESKLGLGVGRSF